MIYLDYAAATPMDPRVFEEMKPYMLEHFANPSSIHRYGQKARQAIDEARTFFAKVTGAASVKQIIFTSGGTESCNLAIFGAALAKADGLKKGAKPHIIVSAIEHAAVLEPARYLRDNHGFALSEIMPNELGIISPEDIKKALKPETVLVSIMYANNEVGSVQPIKKIAKLAARNGSLMHTDACQAPGFLDINAEHLGVDLMSLSASKIYGPKAAGLLFVRSGVKIVPRILGGGQEFGNRGGTESAANIVGFHKAMELLLDGSAEKAKKIGELRGKLWQELKRIKGINLNGPALQDSGTKKRLENNLNIYVQGASAESLVMRLDIEGLAASGGSACSSGKTEPSHVIAAMFSTGSTLGASTSADNASATTNGAGPISTPPTPQAKKRAAGSIRLTLGRRTTAAEIKSAAKILKKVILDLSK